MKFLILIDRIYSKIMIFFLFLPVKRLAKLFLAAKTVGRKKARRERAGLWGAAWD